MSYLPGRFSRRIVCIAACAFVLAGGVGCTLFRNLGTGEHLDTPRQHSSSATVKKRDMLIEVTTDANGAVVSVQFKRSSGSDPIDNYVADTIRNGWPQVPSKITLAEVTYSVAEGFSQPRMISSRPAP